MSLPLLFINSITVSPYFVPTKHLTLIGDYFLSYWIVLLATRTSSRNLQLSTFQDSPDFVGIVSIKIHVIEGMSKINSKQLYQLAEIFATESY